MRGSSGLAALLSWSGSASWTAAYPIEELRDSSNRVLQVDRDLRTHFRRSGSPVPGAWHPHAEKLLPPTRGQRSVAQLTEEQVAPHATISYVYPMMISRQQARYSRHTKRSDASFHEQQSTGRLGTSGRPGAIRRPRPNVYVYQGYWGDDGEWVDTEGPGHWGDDGEWTTDPEVAEEKSPWEVGEAGYWGPDGDWVSGPEAAPLPEAADPTKNPWEVGEAGHWGEDGEWISDLVPLLAEGQQGEDVDESRKTGISRCGFSWDDAAAKMGAGCEAGGWEGQCTPPEGTVDDPDSYWYGETYECFTDVPDLGELTSRGKCFQVSPATTDEWCESNCNVPGGECNPDFCKCEGDGERQDVFNVSAPIQQHDSSIGPDGLPEDDDELVKQVKREGFEHPSGLPGCTWQPPKGCKKTAQYQCIEGKQKGQCSGENWFGRPKECSHSCVHTALLPAAPYSALWYPGPLAREFKPDESQPRYNHTASKLSLLARGIDLSKSDVMLSATCKSKANQFVGVALYSPKYEGKARRLLRSCSRVGVCCKATLLRPDAFGKDALEGTDAFRYEVIASKPSFILGELESTNLPVVFLDTDLEFYSFPHLFVRGGWPNGGRDIAIFNFWGNETDPEHAGSPNTGSGVVFFNHTQRAKSVLIAWAEAMAWKENTRAPDDQVFDTILKAGGWLTRASFGWLPSSYLRTMPAYYRGISPVIDHDHGSAPGLLTHSDKKPHLPPIDHWELCDPDHGKKSHMHEAAPGPSVQTPHGEQEAPRQETERSTLPIATCTATNPELGEDDSDVRRDWSSWCQSQCNPPDGRPEDCATPEMTGNAMCVCKSKAEVDKEAKAQAKADEAQARAEAQAQAKAEAEARVQARAEAQAQAKAEAEARVQAEVDAKAQAKAEAEAEVQAEVDAKAQAKAQAKEKAEFEAAAEEEGRVWAEASGIKADQLCPGHPHVLRSSPSCTEERIASLATEAARIAAGTLQLDEGAD